MSELKLTDADTIEVESFYDGQSKQTRDGKLEVDRWTNYGHDRLYINAGISKCDKYSLYIDLQTHEIVSDNDGKHKGGSVEINGDTAEITIIESGLDDKEHVITVSLEGDGFEASNDGGDDENNDDDESEAVQKAKRVRARIHKYARAGNHRLAENSADSYDGIPGEDDADDEPKLVADGGNTKTERDIELRKTDSGHYIARVVLTEMSYNEQYGTWEPSKPERVGQYAFVPLDEGWIADNIRGEVVETDGQPIGYIGNSTGKHYYEPADHDELPADVLGALADSGLTLVDGFAGGWADWSGRPEWSESYIDLSETDVVAGANNE